MISVQLVCTLNAKISLKRLISNACDLAGARTQDPHIKSVMLYLLSYQVILVFAVAKVRFFLIRQGKKRYFFL